MRRLSAILFILALSISSFVSCSDENAGSALSSNNEDFIFSDYATDTEDDFSSVANEINTVGNTASNLSNGGYFARQGEVLYFRNEDMSGYLTKMGTDCTSPELVITDVTLVNNINIIGDNLYFSSDLGGIYTVKTDKSGFLKILDGDCIYLTATADKLIYALNAEGTISVYSSNTDGSEAILLKSSAGLTGDFSFEGGRLYYSFKKTETVKDYVCYVSVDGRESGAAYTSYCENFTVLNSKIYAYDAGALNIVSLSDSSDKKAISDVNIEYMTTDGTNIYFTDSKNGNIYSISISSGVVSKLNSYPCSHLSLFGNHIFYSQTSSVNPSGYCHWRMRTDGTFDAKRVFAIF